MRVPGKRLLRLWGPWASGCIVATTLLLLAALGGCQPDMRKRMPVVVASDQTPEQLVLGHIAVQALDAAGYQVTDHVGFGDEAAVRRALEAGSAHVVWSYTGDVWINALGHDHPISDPGEVYRRVRDEDRFNGITWLAPAPCERASGLVMPEALAAQYGIVSISGLAKTLAGTNPDLRLCVPALFQEQSGGLRGLQRVYELNFRANAVHTLTVEESYDALLNGSCDCAFGYGNDVAVIGGTLRFLQDDRGFFQASSLAVGVSTAALQEFPELAQSLAEVTQLLDEPTRADLYRRVAIEGEDPQRIARRFLREHGLLGRRRYRR